MNPADVYEALKAISATALHHANTVSTSCTFLEQGGLLSRGFVEKHKLIQTAQPTDAIDKKYDIWDRIFLDHVDIHYRGGAKKGPNKYGPVLFVLDLDVLLGLPSKTEILVTKQNPMHWNDDQVDVDRWYMTVDELSKNINFGDFDKMLVVETPTGRLDFPDKKVRIFLDNPQRKMPSGEDAYAHAEKRLKTAAAKGTVTAPVSPHGCRDDCTCVKKYAGYGAEFFDSRFA